MIRNHLAVAAACLAAGFLTLFVFQSTTENLFVWDTRDYLRYEFWLSSLRWEHLLWMLTSLEASNWHPLTWLSWAVDYRVYGGLDPAGFHFTNNLLHAINSALVLLLAIRVFRMTHPGKPENQPGLGILFAALVTSTLFAVHPLRVESVAWVAERKDLLCVLFMLVSILAYLSHAERHFPGSNRWLRVSLIAAVLAAMAKPMAVSLPLILLLADVYPLRRTRWLAPSSPHEQAPSWKTLLGEKSGFLVIALLLAGLTMLAQQPGLKDFPLPARLLNAGQAVVFYLEKTFWPNRLSPYYPHFVLEGGIGLARQAVGILFPLAATALAIFAWRRGRPAWLMAWAFYLITLAPTLGIIQVGTQAAADRYTYLPTLPLFLLAGGASLAVMRRMDMKLTLPLVVTFFCVIFFLMRETRQQIRIWHDSVSLWARAVEIYPESSFLHSQLGIGLLNAGRNEEAVSVLDKAGSLQKEQSAILAWRSIAYMRAGRYGEAIAVSVEMGLKSERIEALSADTACIQYNIGWNFAQLGSWDEATEMFRRSASGETVAADAAQWLEWLELASNKDGTSDLPAPPADLPGYCPRPLLSMT